VNLQKRNSERNRYYWNLDRQKKNLPPSSDFNEESKKRKTGETVMVSFLTSIGHKLNHLSSTRCLILEIPHGHPSMDMVVRLNGSYVN